MSNNTDTIIIYSSFMGKTRKVAQYLADSIGADIIDLKNQSNIDLSAYSRVILGTGVHAGRPYGKLAVFVQDNQSTLNDKDTILFLCCMFKGEKADAQCEEIARNLNIGNAVYFTRGEKNSAGISKDVDVFAERMRS